MTAAGSVRRFGRQSRTRQRLLLSAYALLLVTHGLLAVPVVSVQWIQRVVGRLSRTLAADSAVERDDVTWSVDVLSPYLPASVTCLRRAIVAQSMLDAHGYPSHMRIGVRKHGSAFRAHAWVEHEGRVLLGDIDDLAEYTPLPADETGLRAAR